MIIYHALRDTDVAITFSPCNACLYQFCKVQISFNNINDRNFCMPPLSKVFLINMTLIFRASELPYEIITIIIDMFANKESENSERLLSLLTVRINCISDT